MNKGMRTVSTTGAIAIALFMVGTLGLTCGCASDIGSADNVTEVGAAKDLQDMLPFGATEGSNDICELQGAGDQECWGVNEYESGQCDTTYPGENLFCIGVPTCYCSHWI